MSTRVLILVLGAGLTAAACAPPADSPAPAAEPQPSISSLYEPVVELADVMRHVVNYNAVQIWNLDSSNPPTTDAEWAAIEASAVTLAAAGGITGLGGSGDFDQEWLERAQPNPVASPREVWERFSQGLSDAGLRTVRAARAQDVEAVIAAGGELAISCVNCHREYRLDVPDTWEGQGLPPGTGD